MPAARRLGAVRPLLFLLVWAGCLETSAQSGWQPFERVIDYEDHVEAAATMTILDDTIYFFSKGWNQQDPYMLRKVVLNKCDLEGNIISQRILFENDPYSYTPTHYTELLVTPDSNLILIAARTDGISPSYPYDVFVARLTRNGDTLWTNHFPTADTSETPYNCKWTPWGNILCIGWSSRSPAVLDGYITLLSNEGEQLWKKYLNYSSKDGVISIARLHSNPPHFIVTGSVYSGQGPIGMRWTVDTLGALLSFSPLSGPEYSAVSAFPDLAGGYLTHQRTPGVLQGNHPIVVRKYDASWQEQWNLYLDDQQDNSQLTHAERMPDSSFWLCGWAYTDENPTSSYAQLVKVSQDGKVDWYRRFYLTDINTTAHLNYVQYHAPTHGVYGIGTTLRPGRNNSDAWLVRFDSVGCLEPGCDTIVGQEFPLPLQPENLSVFPNPASAPMAVDIPPKLREPGRELIIRNLAGQQVQSHTLTGTPRKMVDVGDLPSGLYLAEVWGSEGLLGRVKFVRQ